MFQDVGFSLELCSEFFRNSGMYPCVTSVRHRSGSVGRLGQNGKERCKVFGQLLPAIPGSFQTHEQLMRVLSTHAQ
jgi:hypothetical protein